MNKYLLIFIFFLLGIVFGILIGKKTIKTLGTLYIDTNNQTKNRYLIEIEGIDDINPSTTKCVILAIKERSPEKSTIL